MDIEVCDLRTDSQDFEEMLSGMGRILHSRARYVASVNDKNGEQCCFLVCDTDGKLLQVLVLADEIQGESGSLIRHINI